MSCIIQNASWNIAHIVLFIVYTSSQCLLPLQIIWNSVGLWFHVFALRHSSFTMEWMSYQLYYTSSEALEPRLTYQHPTQEIDCQLTVTEPVNPYSPFATNSSASVTPVCTWLFIIVLHRSGHRVKNFHHRCPNTPSVLLYALTSCTLRGARTGSLQRCSAHDTLETRNGTELPLYLLFSDDALGK